MTTITAQPDPLSEVSADVLAVALAPEDRTDLVLFVHAQAANLEERLLLGWAARDAASYEREAPSYPTNVRAAARLHLGKVTRCVLQGAGCHASGGDVAYWANDARAVYSQAAPLDELDRQRFRESVYQAYTCLLGEWATLLDEMPALRRATYCDWEV